ncbi:MAG: TonB-dependent receptor [Blastocatellia bacterium]|nr:TonB-dependent receptor [Blastocatellia bacterium]
MLADYANRMRRLASPFLLLISLAGAIYAQIGGGSIVGVVTDESGAALPAATVKATNVQTNVTNTTVSNAQGYYEFPLLPAGRYAIEVVAQGFQPAKSQEIGLNSGTRPKLDFSLKTGVASDVVNVTATTPLVNATTNDLGVVIDQNKVESLPLNGRNYQQLVGLQAGVVNAPSNPAGGRGGIEFNGLPALGNNLLLDGVDMSFGEVNATGGAAAGADGPLINAVSVEAIQEFKATGSAFSAEYGRATGGVLNITTKSGTNQFHGTAFEYFRNDALDANSFFSNLNGLEKPPLRWNQFGGNLGGPIRRDKLFFFFNYEGAIVRRAAQIAGNVPTPALLAQVTPEIREALSQLPQDFTPTSNPLIGLHTRNDQTRNDEHTYLGRLDWALGNHRISGRYNYNHQDFVNPQLMPDHPQIYPNRTHNLALQDNFTISPTMFNEFRVGFNRADLDRNFENFDQLSAFLSVTTGNLSASLLSFIHFTTNTYSVVDNFTNIRGNHTLKTGFEIRDVRSYRTQGGLPTHTYNTLADLIADNPIKIGLVFNTSKRNFTTDYGFYAQDDWRISPRFQFNFGLRYEYYTPLTGAYNITGSDPFGAFGPSNTEPYFASDKNNFAPRLGLVWDILGDQKLVMRAGGGITYAPPQPIFYYDMAYSDPRLPLSATFARSDVPASVNISFPFPQSFVSQVVANPSLLPAGLVLSRSITDYNREDEYAGQWNLSLQSELTKTLAVQASYVGSRGLHLYTSRALNLIDPTTGKRPVPSIGQIDYREDSASSSYHALQLSVNKKIGFGFTTDVYYTYARAMEYGGADATVTTDGTVQDYNNVAGSYGPKPGGARHSFVNVYSYDIPTLPFVKNSAFGRQALAGWSFQGIITRRSGLPLDVTAGRDLLGSGRSAANRPDLVLGVNPYLKNTDALTWLNPAAFDVSAPDAQNRYGTLGYDAFLGPSAFTYDAALHKTFMLTERQRLNFRFEMFNALNHPALNNPVTNFSDANFGKIRTASGGRNIQFALKYQF